MTPLLLTAALLGQPHTTGDLHGTHEIGRSGEGRPLVLTTLGAPIDSADERPAILVVAGLDGEDRFSTRLVEGIGRRLISDHASLLEQVTFYLLPLGNPDGADRTGRHGTARRIDQDRDGSFDEDPPQDLDGNGIITMMRRANPPLDDPPTHLSDPAEPRLMKAPDHERGERATHSLHVEGIDRDGDGLIGEDGFDGVLLDRNFMHRWPEYALDSGPFQLSESESRAIADFVLAHPNIVAAVVYGRHDNLLNQPDASSKDITGRAPIELAAEDLTEHKKVADLYRRIVGQRHSSTVDSAGSLHAWLYAQRGIPTWASTGWGCPEDTGSAAEGDSGTSAADDPDGHTAEDEASDHEPSDPMSARWLAYSDRVRSGTGFVEWTPFEHPQLGPVEIGGWVPDFRIMPPEEDLPSLEEAHARWLAAIADRRPRLEVVGPEVESLGGDLVRVRLGIRNTGGTATRNHQAVVVRAQRPTNVRLVATADQLIEGPRLHQIQSIRPGELLVHEWTLRTDGPELAIEIDDPVLAFKTRRILEVSP